jgi:anti-sigma-K factor RskA
LKYEKTTEEKQEQAALYALGALSQHEARAFEYQLHEGNMRTESELESFEKVVGVIGYTVEPVEPPAYLLDVLTARLKKEHQESAAAQSIQYPERGNQFDQADARSRAANSPQFSKASQNVAPFPDVKQAPKSSALSFVPWAIAASLAVCAIVGFLAWRNAKLERDTLKNQVASVQSDTIDLRNQLNQESNRIYQLARINQALRMPNSRIIELTGQEVARSSTATIYWDTKGNQWVVAANLPPAPEGKVYQLWFVTPEAKVSAGLIKTDSNGNAFTVVDVPIELTNLAAAAITLEPEGGSAQPTMPIYTVGKIAS